MAKRQLRTETTRPHQSLHIRIEDLRTITPLTPNQKSFFQHFNQYQAILLHGSPGTGKAQPLTSKILTPGGWTLMGDIEEGDVIIAADGSNTTVTGVFPQGEKEIYEIKFHDGSSTRACGEHLWNVWYTRNNDRTFKQEPHTISTEEIINILESGRNVAVDLYTPLEGEDADLPIHPYLLGALLGDGGLTHFISFTSADQSIVDRVEMLLEDGYTLSKRTDMDYHVIRKACGTNPKPRDPYRIKLNNLVLHGKKSGEKFIPPMYMWASLEQRKELLRGLMDTDGTAGKRQGDTSFTTISEQLAKDVQQLVWSIGGIATITTHIPTYTHNGVKRNGCLAYTLHIAVHNPKELFHLERKKDRVREIHADGRVKLRRRIQSINLIETAPAQCIMVDHPDHLYVTDDYIVTHNTFLTLYKSLESILDKSSPYDQLIIIRNTIPTTDIGFLPGDLETKNLAYEEPYKQITSDLFNRNDAYSRLKEQKYLTFLNASYLRGITFDNSIIFVDEIQNANWHTIKTIISRTGVNTKIILSGDTKQSDMTKKYGNSGFHELLQVTNKMMEFFTVHFTPDDIVRSSFTKSFIITCEELNL